MHNTVARAHRLHFGSTSYAPPPLLTSRPPGSPFNLVPLSPRRLVPDPLARFPTPRLHKSPTACPSRLPSDPVILAPTVLPLNTGSRGRCSPRLRSVPLLVHAGVGRCAQARGDDALHGIDSWIPPPHALCSSSSWTCAGSSSTQNTRRASRRSCARTRTRRSCSAGARCTGRCAS